MLRIVPGLPPAFKGASTVLRKNSWRYFCERCFENDACIFEREHIIEGEAFGIGKEQGKLFDYLLVCTHDIIEFGKIIISYLTFLKLISNAKRDWFNRKS